jgi:acid phosphatase type 7
VHLLFVLGSLLAVREGSMRAPLLLWAAATWLAVSAVAHPGRRGGGGGEQPLSRIAVESAVLAVDDAAHVRASPLVLGLKVSCSSLHFSPPLLFGCRVSISGSLTV